MIENSAKEIVKGAFIYVIGICVYSILAFFLPFSQEGIFYTAYIIGLVAWLAQILFLIIAYKNANTYKKRLYAFPIVKKGYIYLAVQLVLTFVFFGVNTYNEDLISAKAAIIISALILCVFTVIILLTDTARDKVEKIESDTVSQVSQVKTFRISVDSIMSRATDAGLRKVLGRLSETAKYSDPVSTPELSYVEGLICQKVGELNALVGCGNIEGAKSVAEETIRLFEDRNAMCKSGKKY